MSSFVEAHNVSFWKMRPHDDLIETNSELIYCLACENSEYLIYFINGGTAQVKLPDCEFLWFNPRDGFVYDTGSLEQGTAEFCAPDSEDWVLHIKATGNHQ
jgi:hypothetical protein